MSTPSGPNLVIHIDGGSRGNPGPAAAGVLIERDDGAVLHEAGYYLDTQTNNVAEYRALLIALKKVLPLRPASARICSDSELLVRQVTGEYAVKSPRLEQLYREAQVLLLRIPRWHFQHVRREFNQRADALANRALDAHADVIVRDELSDPPGRGVPAGDASHAPGRAATDAPDPAGRAARGSGDKPARKRTAKSKTSNLSGRPSTAAGAGSACRGIRVMVTHPPGDDECPTSGTMAQPFVVDAALPAGLCLHAAHALLPTMLAMKHMDPREFGAVPTLTVRCGRPGCDARFSVSPSVSGNGAPPA
ncbi:MAG: ribonuclease HI family protein [Phycisphaerae bacterium]